MYDFLKYYNLKVTVVATKMDKISPNQREKCKKQILDSLDLVLGDTLVLFSSVSKDGKKDIYERIEKYLDFIDD
jgi:GTP-binding protein